MMRRRTVASRGKKKKDDPRSHAEQGRDRLRRFVLDERIGVDGSKGSCRHLRQPPRRRRLTAKCETLLGRAGQKVGPRYDQRTRCRAADCDSTALEIDSKRAAAAIDKSDVRLAAMVMTASILIGGGTRLLAERD